jgi:hypothetical protein
MYNQGIGTMTCCHHHHQRALLILIQGQSLVVMDPRQVVNLLACCEQYSRDPQMYLQQFARWQLSTDYAESVSTFNGSFAHGKSGLFW